MGSGSSAVARHAPFVLPQGPSATLRSEFRCAADEMSSRSGPVRAVVAIALHVASATALAVVAERLRAVAWGVWIATLPLIWLFIGSRFRALCNMMHECCHRTLVRGRRVSRAFGHLLSFFDFTDFVDYAVEHLSHHRYLGHPERDLDFSARRVLFERLGPFGPRHIWLPLTLFHLPYYVRPLVWCRRDSLPVAIARAGFLALLAAVGVVLGWDRLILYYLVPYLTTYQIFRFWSDAADHAGLTGGETEFDRARNHIFRFAPLNWLVFPRHDQYHLVHHMFPGITTRHLPAMHARLLAAPSYAARAHAFGAFR